VKGSLHKRSLIKIFTQTDWSHSQPHIIFKLVEAEALLYIHHCFLSQSIKQRVLPISAFPVSLHHLPKMSEVNSHICKNASAVVTWSEPLKIRWHAIVTQQRATLEQCARKFRNVNLQTEWTWVNCKLNTASHQNSEVGCCAVWVPHRWKKVFWLELNHLIAIKMLTSNYPKIFGS